MKSSEQDHGRVMRQKKSSVLATAVCESVSAPRSGQSVATDAPTTDSQPTAATAAGEVPNVPTVAATGAKPAGGDHLLERALPVSLKLDLLTLDPSIQSRIGVNEAQVEIYMERMLAGDVFPPLVVFNIDGHLLVADGCHRYRAACKAGFANFQVEVRHGTRTDAIKHALQANTSHGLPRTNADKNRGVRMALSEFPGLSDGALADLVRVSQAFVSKIRRELKTVLSSGKRTGRNGKIYKDRTPRCHEPVTASSNPCVKAASDYSLQVVTLTNQLLCKFPHAAVPVALTLRNLLNTLNGREDTDTTATSIKEHITHNKT